MEMIETNLFCDEACCWLSLKSFYRHHKDSFWEEKITNQLWNYVRNKTETEYSWSSHVIKTQTQLTTWQQNFPANLSVDRKEHRADFSFTFVL